MQSAERDLAALRAAAQQGDADAQETLGDLYHKGQGVVRDDKEALKWWSRAAASHNAQAMRNIANAYSTGSGMPVDYPSAAYWYQKAAREGDAQAQILLGIMYFGGKGVLKNDAEALRLWRESASQGNAIAQKYLGLAYDRGIGVKKNPVRAYAWFDTAVAHCTDEALCKSIRQDRDGTGKSLTRGQRIQAERLARQWKSKPVDADVALAQKRAD